MMVQSLDAINNAMSKYVTVLEALDAAVAKAAAAKAAAAKAAAAKAKTTTITCVKGKLTKKVTAVKPVCTAGYKKK
jgi:carbohydrate-binding DOMON domain-containing protein